MAARSRRPSPPALLGGAAASVLDALPISIYVVDRELRVVAWNTGREQGPQGIPRDQVLGRSLRRIFPASAARVTAREVEGVLRSRRPQTDTVETRTGRIYRVGRYPVFEGRKVSHVLCNFEDITERRAMELRLIASDRLAFLGQLVAGVAHEVSNPLAGIAGCAEALASIGMQSSHKVARRQAKEFRDLIRGEVARCERIIRTLLDAARPGAGDRSDLKEQVAATLRLLERHPAFARVKVVSRIPERLPPGQIEPDSLKQVMMALALNAGRAMAGGGTLTIRAGRIADRLFLDVMDTGPGIPTEMRTQIFEPFFSTDPTQGTGLGLAIARNLVRGRGGDLVYRSRQGAGACFRVLLQPAEGGA